MWGREGSARLGPGREKFGGGRPSRDLGIALLSSDRIRRHMLPRQTVPSPACTLALLHVPAWFPRGSGERASGTGHAATEAETARLNAEPPHHRRDRAHTAHPPQPTRIAATLASLMPSTANRSLGDRGDHAFDVALRAAATAIYGQWAQPTRLHITAGGEALILAGRIDPDQMDSINGCSSWSLAARTD